MITADEYLVIDDVTLATPAWWVESLAPLFNLVKRGQDRLISGVAGQRAKPRRITTVSVSLILHVSGNVDETGAAVVDYRQGLYSNLRYLEENLLADVALTRSATWHQPDGSTRTADVHVEAFTITDTWDDAVKGTLELTIPAGRWEDSGS